MRIAAWTLLAALAAGPLGALPVRARCCAMPGMQGMEAMACCELGADTGSSCQLKPCGSGSATDVLTVGWRAETPLAPSPMPALAVAVALELPAATSPLFELPAPPVPPPRG